MRKIPILILVSAFLLCACAGTQEQWDALSNQEKSRIIIAGFQNELNTLFDTGKAYVIANPEYNETWKIKILPAMSLTNEAIASTARLSMTEEITPDMVYSEIQPFINEVIFYLVEIGAIKED